MLSLTQLVVVLDGTIVNIALPQAQLGLGLSDVQRQWVVTAYALAGAITMTLGLGSLVLGVALDRPIPALPLPVIGPRPLMIAGPLIAATGLFWLSGITAGYSVVFVAAGIAMIAGAVIAAVFILGQEEELMPPRGETSAAVHVGEGVTGATRMCMLIFDNIDNQ